MEAHTIILLSIGYLGMLAYFYLAHRYSRLHDRWAGTVGWACWLSVPVAIAAYASWAGIVLIGATWPEGLPQGSSVILMASVMGVVGIVVAVIMEEVASDEDVIDHFNSFDVWSSSETADPRSPADPVDPRIPGSPADDPPSATTQDRPSEPPPGYGPASSTEQSADETASDGSDTDRNRLEEYLDGFETAILVVFAGVLAALATTVIETSFSPPVTVTLTAAALIAAGLALMPDYPRFAAVGAVYFLSAAAIFWIHPVLPDIYQQDAAAMLALFGTVSLAIVTVQETVGYLIRRTIGRLTNEEYASALWRLISSLVGLAVMVWVVLTAHEKAIRYGGAGGGLAGGFALNIVDAQLIVPLWWLGGVDVSIILFTGGLIVAFHTLDTLYAGWYAAKTGAKAGVRGAKAGIKKARETTGDRD